MTDLDIKNIIFEHFCIDEKELDFLGQVDYSKLVETLHQLFEKELELSLCPYCNCMTTAICGKCKEVKYEKEE